MPRPLLGYAAPEWLLWRLHSLSPELSQGVFFRMLQGTLNPPKELERGPASGAGGLADHGARNAPPIETPAPKEMGGAGLKGHACGVDRGAGPDADRQVGLHGLRRVDRSVGERHVVGADATAAGLDQRVVEIVGVCDLYGVIVVVVRTDPDEVGSRWQRVGCAGSVDERKEIVGEN